MKNIKTIYLIIFVFIGIALPSAESQDSLTLAMIEEFSYSFKIENGAMQGVGSDFLSKECALSQYTLIGEYHGSKRISEFTSALIPTLDKLNYKSMALEVGPISGQLLNKMSTDSPKTKMELHKLNSVYNYDNGEYTAIPFFSDLEDADFLTKASANKWHIFGIDQEFYFGFELLIDEMFDNLTNEQKQQNQKSYQLAKDSVINIMNDDIAGKRRLPTEIHNSKEIQVYLDKMNRFSSNQSIVIAFRKSIEIYKLNNDRKWRQNNEQRALYMKENLRKNLTAQNFDISKDKLVVKLGAYHNSKGESPMNVYDIGNTLNELAEFYGNSTLNIAFTPRFYIEDSIEKDILVEEPKDSYSVFAALGSKKEWVVIDLREIKNGLHYYPLKYIVSDKIEDLVRRYDLLVIPPTEMDPTPNFTTKK